MPKKIQKVPQVKTGTTAKTGQTGNIGRATMTAAKAAATPGSSPEPVKRKIKEAPTYSQVAASRPQETHPPGVEESSPT